MSVAATAEPGAPDTHAPAEPPVEEESTGVPLDGAEASLDDGGWYPGSEDEVRSTGPKNGGIGPPVLTSQGMVDSPVVMLVAAVPVAGAGLLMLCGRVKRTI